MKKGITAIIVLWALHVVVTGADAASPSTGAHHDYHVYPAKLSGKKFKTLQDAKAACGTGPVVWLNPTGVVFHTSTSRWFGHTRTGIYTCETTAKAAGFWKSKY